MRKILLASLAILVTSLFALSAIWLPPRVQSVKSSQVLLASAGANVDPAFSPDGRKVAYSSDVSGSYQLMIMDVTGRHKYQLTDLPGSQRNPQWSPDGRFIAFLSIERNSTTIQVIDTKSQGSSIVVADTHSNQTSFDWCHLRPLITFDAVRNGFWEIFVFDLSDGTSVQLTHSSGDNRYPSWTPDCGTILFSSDRTGLFKIFQITTDGLTDRQLTAGYGDDLRPVMSPNGLLIAFSSNSSGTRTPWLMSSNGSSSHLVISNPVPQKPGLGYSPEISAATQLSWRSDSKALLIQGMYGQVFAFYLDTAVLRYNGAFRGTSIMGNALIMALAGPALHLEPVWAPDGNSFAYVSNSGEGLGIYLNVVVAKSPNPYA